MNFVVYVKICKEIKAQFDHTKYNAWLATISRRYSLKP